MTQFLAKPSQFLRLGTALLCTVLAAGCSKIPGPQSPAQESLVVDLDFGEQGSAGSPLEGPLRQQEHRLQSSSLQAEMAQKITGKKPVFMADILSIILSDHAELASARWSDTPMSALDLEQKIESYIKDQESKSKANPHFLKVDYEADLLKDADQSTLYYNAQASSMVHIFRDTRKQCYSGSLLNMLAFKMALQGKSPDQGRIPVVLFTQGHLLPGYILPEGEDFRLYGVETTFNGRAIVDYGLTHRLDKDLNRSLRVVLMDDFLVVEALKTNLRLSPRQKRALVRSAVKKLKRFEVPYEELEQDIEQFVNLPYRFDKETLNSNPFSFGAADSNDEDRVPEEVDFSRPVGSVVPLSPHPFETEEPTEPYDFAVYSVHFYSEEQRVLLRVCRIPTDLRDDSDLIEVEMTLRPSGQQFLLDSQAYAAEESPMIFDCLDRRPSPLTLHELPGLESVTEALQTIEKNRHFSNAQSTLTQLRDNPLNIWERNFRRHAPHIRLIPRSRDGILFHFLDH